MVVEKLNPARLPHHVAIIMDGNGRWAKSRLQNRLFGHEEGAGSVREVVRCCSRLGIPYLTLYAFSKENWKRPAAEVKGLWNLLGRFLKSELPEIIEQKIQLRHIGDEEGIPPDIMRQLRAAVAQTAAFEGLVLTLAINYGGRQEIVAAVRKFTDDVLSGRESLRALSPDSFSRYLLTTGLPDPDLVIRTGGEYRVSNFLLWQIAYSEIFITPTLWPDFKEREFMQALKEYQGRERRFGMISEQVHDASGTRGQ